METELCQLARKYKTDKCHEFGHFYTPVYYELLKDKKHTIKKVLEIGVGAPEVMHWLQDYKAGASLKMWRDFFPNAQIYGVDIAPTTMFKDDRITTFLLDSRKSKNMRWLINEIGNDIDLIIDDGCHRTASQLRTVRNIKPLVKKDAIYIIEDSKNPYYIKDLLKEYSCEIFEPEEKYRHKQNNLILVKNV